ncbi:Severin [Leucoagaricus sp. SymC.cos]|nr:Severin [Leucoagaricus sp. SymC.cos]
MAYSTKPTQYNIEDSNIALLRSDLEKHVREHAGDKEAAWENAGINSGLQIWRIERFHVVEWPRDRYGQFYDGDSYIVLHVSWRNDISFSYGLHFWLGGRTTQDEAGTAAYKTVELDDYLHGKPVQYREVQGYESSHFLSYFPQFVCLRGGTTTGFHHVTEPPPQNVHKLYRVDLSHYPNGRSSVVVREVPAEASSLVEGDVYVLDQGSQILQFNSTKSAGQERFKAAEFVRSLADQRKDESEIVVYDEGGPGASRFLTELGAEALVPAPADLSTEITPATLYKLSDESGFIAFTRVALSEDSLSSNDAFLLDNSWDSLYPTVYVWLGRDASLNERRLSVQYAQDYLHQQKQKTGRGRIHIPVIKQKEGHEVVGFLHALKGT